MKNILSATAQKCFRLISITLLIGIFLLVPFSQASSVASAATTLPFLYTFNSAGTLYESDTKETSTSPYLWLKSGAKLESDGTIGKTIQGQLSPTDAYRTTYAGQAAVSSDNGTHPQNMFQMFAKIPVQNTSAQIYIKRVADNLATSANRQSYIGEMLLARYKDENNYYYAGLRADGGITIKKKTNGVFQTLASKQLFPGTYNASTNPDLIPLQKWIGLKFLVVDSMSGAPQLTLYTDVGQTGTWQQSLTVLDDSTKFGSSIAGAGLVGVQSDYADALFDNLRIEDASAAAATLPPPPPPPSSSPSSTYDSVVNGDTPVMYLTMGSPSSGSEQDKSGHGNSGTYKGGTPTTAKLPNGESVADFNGSSQYLTVPSSSSFSIPTTKKLTWEAWIRPDTLQFANASGDGYIDWMGKCSNYSPNCEWEARMYNTVNPQNRTNRLSAYVFNPSAGLGSGADWQPTSGLLQSGEWLHVVAEYQTSNTPSNCSSGYPGTINIWVNGVPWSFASHAPTGCMSQFSVAPKAGSSPLTIGTLALDTWFKGAVGKVAIYDYLLTQDQITEHFKTMTGITPTGSCGATCTIPTL